MIDNILKDILIHGGSYLKIGGYVRDKILGIPNKDTDIEVYNISYENLMQILSKYGEPSTVGVSFGVIKLDKYDFSLPRRESKSGKGHKGFIVDVDSTMTPIEAARRRDYTINSMGEDAEGKIIDYYGGMKDLESLVLRHTSDQFIEDPLRVLRGFQFISRFNLAPHSTLIEVCKSIKHEYKDLAQERVFEEWVKWSKGSYPDNGLFFLVETAWIDHFPCLKQLYLTLQDSIYHPEGDVGTHTEHVVRAMANICDRESIQGEERTILFFSALLHDVGKPITTIVDNGRIKSPGHDVAGVPVARSFLESIGCPSKIIDVVLPLVKEHMVHCYGEVNLRRLAHRLYPATIQQLLYLIEADHSGRPPLEGGLPNICSNWLKIAKEMEIENNKPKPIVLGRHLMELMSPGPQMGKVLKRLYERQLDGEFNTLEEGLKLL